MHRVAAGDSRIPTRGLCSSRHPKGAEPRALGAAGEGIAVKTVKVDISTGYDLVGGTVR